MSNANKQSAFVIVALIGAFIAAQMIADISGTKFVNVLGVTMPGGTLVFALVFTIRDLIHKRLGKDWARAAIITAAAVNIAMAAYFVLIINLQPAPWWENQEAFATILGLVPRITIASIVAEVISGMIDTEVYYRTMRWIPEKHQWARVLLSNGAALPVDSIIFGLIAFYGIREIDQILMVINGQFAWKMAVAVASMPLIYLVKGEFKVTS